MSPPRPAGEKPSEPTAENSRSAGAAGSSWSQDIFDVRKIRRLAELMNEHKLVQLDLQQGETRVRLRRDVGSMPGEVLLRSAAPATASPAALPAEPAPQGAPRAAEPAPKEDYINLIKSPMVGTFYAAPDPDSPSYVKVGDPVGPETTVCVVEAMKVFNEIPAEVAGKIAAVLVENGEPVEYGQPLFKVDTRQ